MFYDKILKINDMTFTFEIEQNDKSYSSLDRAIQDFFIKRAPGIHIAVICTDSEDIIDVEELRQLLQSDSRIVAIMQDTPQYKNCNCQCAIININALSEIFTELLEYLKNADQAYEINSGFKSFLEGVCTMIQGNQDNGLLFSEDTAKRLSDKWNKSEENEIDIRILMYGKEEFFDQFQEKEHYFPHFIQYVVRGLSEIGELQKAEKNILELEEQLKEKDQKISELKKQLKEEKQKNSELRKDGEKNAKLLESIQTQAKYIVAEVEAVKKNSKIIAYTDEKETIVSEKYISGLKIKENQSYHMNLMNENEIRNTPGENATDIAKKQWSGGTNSPEDKLELQETDEKEGNIMEKSSEVQEKKKDNVAYSLLDGMHYEKANQSLKSKQSSDMERE